MALNFPDSPSDGDTFNGYSYNSSKGAWVSSSLNNTGPIVSDTAPSNPINGDFWFDSSSARLYMRYDDGSSSQWLSLSASGADGANGANGADGTPTIYANTSVLPSSGNSVGNLAFATLTKSLHIWDGTEWDRVSTGNNETPRLTTTPASTHSLNGDGTNTAITIVASDPEGFPITYSYDTNPASPNQITNVVENSGVFTLVPSTNSAHAGNFTLRLKASDGVSTISHPITVALTFNTTFTFDTSKSVVNSTYTADNQADLTPTANQIAHTEENAVVGKGYFEIKYISGTITYSLLGIAGGNFPAIGGHKRYYSGASVDESVFLHRDGRIYKNNGTNASLFSGNASINDIIMIAYDTATSRVYFGRNGSWGSGHNPATDNGLPINLDSTTNIRPAFTTQQNGGENYRIEIISHTQGAQYTIPTGFSLA